MKFHVDYVNVFGAVKTATVTIPDDAPDGLMAAPGIILNEDPDFSHIASARPFEEMPPRREDVENPLSISNSLLGGTMFAGNRDGLD